MDCLLPFIQRIQVNLCEFYPIIFLMEFFLSSFFFQVLYEENPRN